MNHEAFWLNDPMALFTQHSWVRFVPADYMTVPEALNAVLRFTVYFSIILALVTSKGEYLIAIPSVAALTVVLYKMYPETQVFKESFKNGERTKPTPNNPFMNVSLDEYTKNPNRLPAAPIVRDDIEKSAGNAFAKTSDLFMDTSDSFEMMQSSRAFYTTASTTIPNDLDGYQSFLNAGNQSRKKLSENFVEARGVTSSA